MQGTELGTDFVPATAVLGSMLVSLLVSLPAHMSFIIIEHDLDIALRVSEKVTVMHNGRVLRTGTPAEIEADAQVQAIYMGGHR